MNSSPVRELRRHRNIDRIDENRAAASHLSRADYHLAQKFRRYMIRWAGVDELRWKALCILCLREVNGWTMEMIGLVFGHPKGHVTRVVRDTMADLSAGFLKQFPDHNVDTYTALRTGNAEVIFERMVRLRHLMRDDDHEADEAISDLRDQLAKWRE